MIARIWRGVTAKANAEEYLRFLQKDGIRDYTSTEGNRGVLVLQRVKGGKAEFLLLSLWDSMEAIRRFAGPDAEKAVYYPEDRRYLLSLEPKVEHYQVALGRSPLPSFSQ